MKAGKLIILLLIINVLSVSCKSRKLANQNNQLTTVDAFWNNQQDFEFLSLRGKVTINMNGSDQTASVSIRMAKDSVVWMTAGLMGFEGARALITKDSFKLIDKINRSYYAYGIDVLDSYLGFDMTIGQLQNLLIGNALFSKDNYQVFDSSNYIKAVMPGLTNTNVISSEARLEKSKFTSNSPPQTTDIEFVTYNKFDGITLPTFINTNVKSSSKNSSIVINYKSANTGQISNFPFSIPDGYTKK